MSNTQLIRKTFEKSDFSYNTLRNYEYEGCHFTKCDFSYADLTDTSFSGCEFQACNLSMAKLSNTIISECTFHECKMLGLSFENCNRFLFTASFSHSILNFSNFYKLNLKDIKFEKCILHEVSFIESNLKGVHFDICDLTGTIFEGSLLESADFRTSYGYTIDPENNKMKHAQFSLLGLGGLLQKYELKID